MQTVTLLDYVVARACERHGHNGREFTTANFQNELSAFTGSRPVVTSQVAVAVLLSVPGVRRGITPCTWTYDGPAIHRSA